MKSVEEIIKKLDLEPHPEGGYFRESYRSNGKINKDSLELSYDGERNYSTCIYFLLTSGNFSEFHRIKQDEIWHFYDGSPIALHIISKEGKYSCHTIGREIDEGEKPQFVVSGGSWFAAGVVRDESFSLLGCTVSPGFDFKDFELGSREELLSLFPDHEEVIVAYTHP